MKQATTTRTRSRHHLHTFYGLNHGVSEESRVGPYGNNEQSSSYWTTSQYDPKYAPIIMDGIEYCNLVHNTNW